MGKPKNETGTSGVSDRGIARSTVVRTIGAALLLSALLTGCAPVNDPSAGLSLPESVAVIEHAPRSARTPEELAEAFALNSRATDVQREMLTTDIVGHAVEWDLPVYEVEFAEGRFKVTSQAIPITDADAVALLRVVVFVLPQNETDDALLRAVKTDDVLRIRGIVQEIQLRTVVTIVPAVVAGDVVGGPDTTEPTPSTGTT
jgi:hypothetical protein